MKGYTVMSARLPLMVSLIDRFNQMLERVVRVPQFANATHLDLRTSLSNGTDYKTSWANELHPTRKGFGVVAAKYAAVIK